VFEEGKSFAEVQEAKIKLLTELDPRECIFRVIKNDKFLDPMKLVTTTI
jgi:hypothetical protein